MLSEDKSAVNPVELHSRSQVPISITGNLGIGTDFVFRYKLIAVNLREIFVENFAGDLEYHPRRAVVYLILAVAAFCF